MDTMSQPCCWDQCINTLAI